MPNSTQATGQKWFRCDRSGFWYPWSERRVQNGLQVAARHLDEPGRRSGQDDPRSLTLVSPEEIPYGR